MMGHGYQRTRTAAAVNSARSAGSVQAEFSARWPTPWPRPAPWPNSDDTDDAEITRQVTAIAEFYRQATPEPIILPAARGLAVVARSALDEVLDEYLTPWSAGDVQHKLMAASILSAMADDHLLGPTALEIAVGWARHGGQERAVTAAIALGGRLGQHHLAEASRLLWPLTLRDDRVSRVARLAFGQLFLTEPAADRSAVVRFLVHKVRPLVKAE